MDRMHRIRREKNNSKTGAGLIVFSSHLYPVHPVHPVNFFCTDTAQFDLEVESWT
jgi:hypothetical protein